MKSFTLTALLGAAALSLAACSGETERADNAAANVTEAAADGGASSAGADGASSTWPQGARIVEESGVTYRIDADGTRVALTERDARIVVEDGVRYRVDPGGARIRIDERGVGVDVDPPRLDVDAPDVEVEPGNATTS